MRFKRLSGLAAVATASLIAYATYHHLMNGGDTASVPISVFVGLAAIVGSAINQPFRTDDGSMSYASQALYFAWKCSVAVAFALVLYLVFMGGIISGGLFPDFPNRAANYVGIRSFVQNVNPGTNADFAKLLMWSFVAGFSEKFVPNLIAKLEGQSRAFAKDNSLTEE
jgi:hypothetical protein